MSLYKCKKCGTPTNRFAKLCDEHYRCEDCGAEDGLCYYTEGLLCNFCHTIRVNRRIAEFDGDTQFTPEIVCPHCGYVHSDSWEWSEGESECGDCGQKFEVVRHVDVTYSTSK